MFMWLLQQSRWPKKLYQLVVVVKALGCVTVRRVLGWVALVARPVPPPDFLVVHRRRLAHAHEGTFVSNSKAAARF